jgi:hypothetical protein
MTSNQSRGAIVAVVCALVVCGARAEAAEPFVPDPCTLLTVDQLNSATGFAFAAGTPIIAGKSCQWISPSPKHGIVTVDFYPGESWDKMKAPLAGFTKTSVSGVGDDAFYTVVGTFTTLSVKKGNAVFNMKVYGIADHAKQEAAEKALALNVTAKL